MRPSDFFRMPVLVVAFGQPGCRHCDDFLPRFRRVAERWSRCIPAAVFDATWFDYAYLKRLGVEVTPSVVVFRYGQKSSNVATELSDAELEGLFRRIAGGVQCPL